MPCRFTTTGMVARTGGPLPSFAKILIGFQLFHLLNREYGPSAVGTTTVWAAAITVEYSYWAQTPYLATSTKSNPVCNDKNHHTSYRSRLPIIATVGLYVLPRHVLEGPRATAWPILDVPG